MKYLIIFFIIIIIIGLLANRELSLNRKRIRQMMREYSYRTYSPKDEDENRDEK
ncbi:MAG: hypothetical protein HXY53_00475 [Nitrospirae bacterium]|nr:hypothetical protein [Nitrospirota bacterium]